MTGYEKAIAATDALDDAEKVAKGFIAYMEHRAEWEECQELLREMEYDSPEIFEWGKK